MLPANFQLPAAIVLLLGGAVACFAGYRLFRVVLAIYGFIIGAMLTSSMMGSSNTTGMIVSAILGGVAGAAILVFAYFVGIALIGAGLGALVAHVGWSWFRASDPPASLIIALAVMGALGAMVLQRYVIIVSTAFAGAWTLLLGATAMLERSSIAARPRGDNVFILYPTSSATGPPWLPGSHQRSQ